MIVGSLCQNILILYRHVFSEPFFTAQLPPHCILISEYQKQKASFIEGLSKQLSVYYELPLRHLVINHKFSPHLIWPHFPDLKSIPVVGYDIAKLANHSIHSAIADSVSKFTLKLTLLQGIKAKVSADSATN